MHQHAEEFIDLSPYKLGVYLGNGSFGKVFTCVKDSNYEKTFAIKLIKYNS